MFEFCQKQKFVYFFPFKVYDNVFTCKYAKILSINFLTNIINNIFGSSHSKVFLIKVLISGILQEFLWQEDHFY